MNSIVAAKAQTVCAKEAHPLFTMPKLRSLGLRGRFEVYRNLLRQHRLIKGPRGSVGAVSRNRGATSEAEVRAQRVRFAQGAGRRPTPRPPAKAADMRVGWKLLAKKTSRGPRAKRTLMDKLRLGKARRAARHQDDPGLPFRKRKAGRMFDPPTGELRASRLECPASSTATLASARLDPWEGCAVDVGKGAAY